MFKLQRQKPISTASTTTATTKSGERFDFSFSRFQALQVPDGWDKLYVSIVSVESGKTIAKSNKASVRNETCRWADTLSESLWIPQEDSSNELEEILLKFVISMGSARSGILGETVINMASYKSSKAPYPVSLPLNKCNHGTILQVEIQCLTPRTDVRDQASIYSNSHGEARNGDHHDRESKSNETDASLAMSLRSQSSQDLGSTSHPEHPGSTETSYARSGSHHSLASEEGSMRRDSLSPPTDLSGVHYNLVSRQDALRSGNKSPYGISADDSFRSNHSSFNSRVTHPIDDSQNYEEEYEQNSAVLVGASSLTHADSSRNLLEAAEDTIEELHNEAKMWERNSQKLTLELEILREKSLSQSKKQKNADMELSTAYAVQDGMKKEIEHLQLLLKELVEKETTSKYSTLQLEGHVQIRRELEKEIKFQKEANTNLALQLKQSQESNIEFLSVLQELEEIIEKQKVEIEHLSNQQLSFSDLESSIRGHIKENKLLLLQSQQLQESEKNLLFNVELLEQDLKVKNSELENDRISYEQSLLDVEREYRYKLSVAEEGIDNLNANLTVSVAKDESVFSNQSSKDLIREIDELKKIEQELETTCRELTNENLELLSKIKKLEKENEEAQLDDSVKSTLYTEISKQLDMAYHNVTRSWYSTSFEVNGASESHYSNLVSMTSSNKLASKVWAESLCNSFMELNKLLEEKIIKCEEDFKTNKLEINKRDKSIAEAKNQVESFSLNVQELQSSNIELQAQLADLQEETVAKESKIQMLEADLLSKDEQIDLSRRCQMELQAQVSDMKKVRDELQENMDIVVRESNITSKCMDDLQTDLMVLRSSVDSHVSANKVLQRKSLEHEAGKRDLELHLFEVEEENIKLLDCISDLEAKLQNVEFKYEASEVELKNSRSLAVHLQDEIKRLTEDIEREKAVLQEKLQNTESRLSEAQEECEYQKIAKQKLQISVESLSKNCSTVQKLNEELKKQNLELNANSKSVAISHEDEIRRLTLMMETENNGLQEKLKVMENQLSEAQEECEYQKIANQISQASAESSSKNCSTLQKLNEELRKQNFELHENSKSVAISFKDEMRRLTVMMETEKDFLQEKLQDMENQLSEAQEECEHHKMAYQNSQVSARSLSDNCNTLQKINEDLKNQNLDLNEKFKLVATALQDEARRLTVEMEEEKVLHQEKLQNMENRLLEAQEECEYQKMTNQKSQVSALNLSKSCKTLQKVNEDLKKQNLDLNENSKTVAIGLQDEIRRLTVEMEAEKVVQLEKLQDMENQLLEAQKECDYLKMMHQKSHEFALNLSENCSTLQKINEDLKKQNLDLNENSKSVVIGLEDEIKRLTEAMEAEKVVQRQKLQDIENQLSEAQEECEYQKTTNQKSARDFSKKCNTLQELNDALTKQIMDLHEHCASLESNLQESQQNLSDSSKKIETLEEKLSSIIEEFVSKEKILTSELDVLLLENRELKEKLILQETLLNQMFMEKTAEVENLQKEVENLINHISVTNDERDRIASEAENEVSKLRFENDKFGCALQDASSRVKLTEDELDRVRTEYSTRVQDLMADLAVSKQKHADHEKVLKRLTSYRSSQEKLKTSVNDLELKLTLSEYERQQLMEEAANLKAHTQKLVHYQEETISLKRKIEEYKLENEKLEALQHSTSLDIDKLKAENSSLSKKVSNLQKTISEFEDCENKRIALEEKLRNMEHDLRAKEASNVEDGELRKEVGRMKREIKQYIKKIQQFEDEKDELLKRAQTYEKDLMLIKAEQHDQSRTGNKKGDNKYDFYVGSYTVGEDYVEKEKVQLLENELAEALEANNRYKLQLQSIFSDGLHSHSAAPRKSVSGEEVVANERFERTKSSLETEIVDLRDRYFQMSLRYAEVEAQREDLVMKLKASNNGKRLFFRNHGL